MNPWLISWPYYWFNKGPLSGDVTQDISPYTNFLSPQIERLRKLNDQIAELKEQAADDLENSAKETLDRLKESDSEALRRVVDGYLD